MKKILFVLLAAFVCSTVSVDMQAATKTQKMMQKVCKRKTKEYSKAGWQVFGSSLPLDVALAKHYEKMEEEGAYELVSTASSTMKNIGDAKLLQNAMELYSSELATSLKGRTVTTHGSDMNETEMQELDQFMQAFESKVQGEIKGEIKASFKIYRQVKDAKGNPRYEFEGYFIVNADKAHQARIAAMKAMQEEAKARMNMSSKAADWINEAFAEEDKARQQSETEYTE